MSSGPTLSGHEEKCELFQQRKQKNISQFLV